MKQSELSESPAVDPTAPAAGGDLVGVFQLLAEQHHQMSALLDQLMRDPATRRTGWPAARQALLAHEQGEVQEVFPVLRAKSPLRPFADHHDAEARMLDAMIRQLDELDVGSDAWASVLATLAATVSAHADEEEREIFPAAQDVLGEGEAIALEAPCLRAMVRVAAGEGSAVAAHVVPVPGDVAPVQPVIAPDRM